MTDARFPERWLNDARLQRLPASAYRTHGNSLMWSVANRTDGHIPSWALAMIPHATEADAAGLRQSGLWADALDGWRIADYEETQTTSGDLQALANARRRQRDKMRRRRSAAAAVPGDVPGHSSGHSTRTGQAKPGAKTEGLAPWLPAEFSDVRGAGGDAAGGNGHPPTPSQTRKRVHDGPDPVVLDVQNFSNRGTSRDQPADRNAREACPVCGLTQKLRTNGKLARHGPKSTPCRGSGLALTGATP